MSDQAASVVGLATDRVEPARSARGKRPSFGQSFLDTWRSGSTARAIGEMIMAFVFALVLGSILLVVSNPDIMAKASYLFAQPSAFFGAAWDKIASTYTALAQGSVGSWGALTETTSRAAPLILAGLGVGLSFRVGLFNIGGQGQAIWGTILAGYVGFTFDLPAAIHLPFAILAGLAGGALWAGVSGFLRARFGANEVITTIMLNYTAMQVLNYILTTSAFRKPGQLERISAPVRWSAVFPQIEGTRLNLGFAMALVAAIVVWWLLERTKLGYQIRAVGANPAAAATAGMKVPLVLTLSMAIAGGLCGLAGAGIILAPNALGDPNPLTIGMVGSVGFDAITVALLGRSRPLGTVLAGLLFGALNAGSLSMQASAGTPAELAAVLQALIVMFVAAPMLVRTLAPFLRERKPAALAAPGMIPPQADVAPEQADGADPVPGRLAPTTGPALVDPRDVAPPGGDPEPPPSTGERTSPSGQEDAR